MLAILLISALLFEGPVLELKDSAHLNLGACKVTADAIYAMEMDGIWVFDPQEGNPIKKIVKKGLGPGELEMVLGLIRAGDDIWAVSRFAAIRIRDGETHEKIKTLGALSGIFQDKSIHQWEQRWKGELYLAYIQDQSKDQKAPFFKAPEELAINHNRTGFFVVTLQGQYLLFGEGLSARFYISDLKSGRVVPVSIQTDVIRTYARDKHGTFPVNLDKRDRKRINKFYAQFDLIGGMLNNFGFEHRGETVFVLTWSGPPPAKPVIQFFDTEGAFRASHSTKHPPMDAFEGNLIFLIKNDWENDRENYKIQRISLDLLLDDDPIPQQ